MADTTGVIPATGAWVTITTTSQDRVTFSPVPGAVYDVDNPVGTSAARGFTVPMELLADGATIRVRATGATVDYRLTDVPDKVAFTTAEATTLKGMVSGAGVSKLGAAVRAYKAGLRTRPPIIFGMGDSNITGEGAGTLVGSYYIGDAFKNSPIQQIRAQMPAVTGGYQIAGCWVENSAFFGEGNSALYPTLTVAGYDPRFTLGAGWAPEVSAGIIGGRFLVGATGGGDLVINFGRALTHAEVHFPVTASLSASVGVYSSDGTLLGSYSNVGSNSLGTLTVTSPKLADGILKIRNNGAASGYVSGVIAWNSGRQEIIVAQGAWSGGTAGNLATITTPWSACGHLDSIQPDCTIAALTINDINAGTLASTYNGYMATITAKAALYGDVILATGHPCNAANWTANQTWLTLEQEMQKVAQVYGARAVSMHKEFYSWAAANSAGYETNSLHQTAAGYARQAGVFASQIRSLIGA